MLSNVDEFQSTLERCIQNEVSAKKNNDIVWLLNGTRDVINFFAACNRRLRERTIAINCDALAVHGPPGIIERNTWFSNAQRELRP